MDSQCECPSVWVSILTMKVQVIAIVCGRRSDAKTSRNESTSCSVQSICMVSIAFYSKSVVTLREKSMRTELSNSRYSRQVIASGNGLPNFNTTLKLPFSGCDV